MITIQAVNSIIQTGDITNSGSGNVTVTAGQGDITMVQDAQTTVAQGSVGYTANDDITLSGITASNGSLEITSENGGILDGNGPAPNIASDNIVVNAPSGDAAGANNSGFLFAIGSESGLPALLVINNRILGGANIAKYYQAISMANASLVIGDFILYNTIFDNIWRWSSNQQMLMPWTNSQSPLPIMAGFTL